MIQATNNFVWIKRDEAEKQVGGLILPSSGQKKPHEGLIISVGKLVQDKTIKADKKCLWHPTVGMEIEYDGITYIVIEGERILSVL